MRLLRSIALRNILSFGPDTPPLELRALNVLIGPNGSGKSNLLDAVELLKKAPDAENLRAALGAEHWFHKSKHKSQTIEIEVVAGLKALLEIVTHTFEIFNDISGIEWFVGEKIESVDLLRDNPISVLKFESKIRGARVFHEDDFIEMRFPEFSSSASCLSQIKDVRHYPTLTHLGAQYKRIRLYREWTFGRNSTPRLPRRTDERNDFLAEDGSNLGLVLNKLRTYPEVKDQFISALSELYEGIKDFDVLVEGNTAQIFLREGNTSIPATRLSDGTLRYLSLLAILLHPTPPPLICLEEPELGLHPDAIVAVGKLIKEASTRTQLIVTTHSMLLLDTFQEAPEDVVVVSKENGSTQFQRLDADKLRPYLATESLGNLWNSGQFGGNRW
ncbi:MAG TPA: AAA family ATPase [Hymenobacter sp.]